MTLAGHLEELRRRLAICFASIVVATGLSFTRVDRIIGWLRRPAEPLLPRLAFFGPMEPLTAYVKVALLAGLVLAMPVLLWQLWAFVRSGLSDRERRYGSVLVTWGSLHFLAGVWFAYVALLPISLRFLLGLGQPHLEPVLSIDRYLSFVTAVLGACGAVFELPVVLFVLARVGLVTSEWLRQQRPYAMLILVIVSALVTPTTDPVTLLLLAVPLFFLYELSILVTRLALRR